MKKLLSLAMSLVMLVTTMSVGMVNAYANTKYSATEITEAAPVNFTVKSDDTYYLKYTPTKDGAMEFVLDTDAKYGLWDYVDITITDMADNDYNWNMIDCDSKVPAVGYDKFVAGKKYIIEVEAYFEDSTSFSGTLSVKPHTSHAYERGTEPGVYMDAREFELGIMKSDGYVADCCTVCSYEKKISSIAAPGKFVISKSKYVYDGKSKKPTVAVYNTKGTRIDGSRIDYEYENNTKVGTATVLVENADDCEKYLIYKPMKFTIVPRSTSIRGISGTKKGFLVKYYRRSTQTTGYQVQCSTGKSFSTKKTVTIKGTKNISYKMTNLKAKKKYYVRVRTYKVVNDKKYYSAWSKVKTVTTKA